MRERGREGGRKRERERECVCAYMCVFMCACVCTCMCVFARVNRINTIRGDKDQHTVPQLSHTAGKYIKITYSTYT